MNPNQETDLIYDCETLLDLIPEYAFGLADPDQTRLVEANLERCPGAVVRLQEYQHLQEEIRSSIPQIEPPPQVGTRLMAAIATPIPAAAPEPVPAAAATVKPRRAFRAAWLVAAAAALALVVSNIYWLTRVADLMQSNDLLSALRNVDNSAFVLTNTSGLHWVRLAEASEGETAAFMMWNNESKTGLLYAHAFPELQPGYKYHLWLTRPDERVFIGILQVDADGNGALLFDSPDPIDDYSWAWVTAETGNGIPDAPAVVKGELNPA